MNRFRPISARLRGKCLGNGEIYNCASEIIEIAPQTDREHPAAISLPSELERVQSVHEETTCESEFDRLRQGIRRHGATMAYRLDNAVLAEGTLYYRGGYNVIRGGSGVLTPQRRDYFAEAQLCTNNVIERYFGHWLNDGLLLGQLAAQMSLQGLVLKRTPWLHEPDYRKISGVQATQTEHALVERLWAIDDRGVNGSWIGRVRKLRDRVLSTIPKAGPKKRIMLARGRLGAKRNLVNSAELQEELEKIGFQIINPEEESVSRIVSAISSADTVVVVEGSAQSHCTYALPCGSTLLTIQPPNRFVTISKDRADAVGYNWAFVVADPHSDGFYLSFDRLRRTIDEIARVTSRREIAWT
jgi:hypothetical protein